MFQIKKTLGHEICVSALMLMEQTDLGLHRSPLHLYVLETLFYKAKEFEFQDKYSHLWSVQSFKISRIKKTDCL